MWIKVSNFYHQNDQLFVGDQTQARKIYEQILEADNDAFEISDGICLQRDVPLDFEDIIQHLSELANVTDRKVDELLSLWLNLLPEGDFIIPLTGERMKEETKGETEEETVTKYIQLCAQGLKLQRSIDEKTWGDRKPHTLDDALWRGASVRILVRCLPHPEQSSLEKMGIDASKYPKLRPPPQQSCLRKPRNSDPGTYEPKHVQFQTESPVRVFDRENGPMYAHGESVEPKPSTLLGDVASPYPPEEDKFDTEIEASDAEWKERALKADLMTAQHIRIADKRSRRGGRSYEC